MRLAAIAVLLTIAAAAPFSVLLLIGQRMSNLNVTLVFAAALAAVHAVDVLG